MGNFYLLFQMKINKITYILFTLTIISGYSWAQKNEKDTFNWFAQYKLSYKMDSLQKEPNVEYMVLMFNQNFSGFRSAGNYLLDSIKQTQLYQKKFVMEKAAVANKYQSNFSDYIRTDLAQNTTTVTIEISGRADMINPQYIEYIKPGWKISKEKKKINDVICTKAETNLFGRKWIAWFATEYPFPFGPYKFFGLPGLIFEITDQTHTYQYTLYNFKKKEKIYPKNIHTNIVKVNKNQSFEMYNANRYTLAKFQYIDEKANADLMNRLKTSLNKQRLAENNPLELKP
jgi:GLPGLI family protein